MNTFFARLCLFGWFVAMFALWLERAVTGIAISGTAGTADWKIHLAYVIAVVVLTNMIFLVQALYLVFTLPVVYFAFIHFKSRAYSFPGAGITPFDLAMYLVEITLFSLIVFWNYSHTDGRGVRLKTKRSPTLQPPRWIR